MSNKFITIKFEPKNDLDLSRVKRFSGECDLVAYTDKEESFGKLFSNKMFLGYNAVNRADYIKGLIECLVNQLNDVVTGADNNTVEYNSRKTKDGIDIELLNLLKINSQLLTYLINSTSWRDSDFRYFDSIEFQTRYEYLKAMCNFYNPRKESEDDKKKTQEE
jgi:hypothetical protein